MRLREDELFVRRIKETLPKGLKNNLHLHDLHLKDAPIRLRVPLDEVEKTPVNPADPSIEKIRKALSRQSELGAMEAVVVPLAIGADVDHLTVREAATPFTANRPTAFYEDLPYIANASEAEKKNPAGPAGEEIFEPIIYRADAAIERKRRLVLGYASQIDEQAGALIANFAINYNGGERLWINRSWRSSFPQDDVMNSHN
jgi:hypothetical protein